MTYSIEFKNYIFDVTKYGATGDGTTDDTTAIQNAMNAACAANGRLYFPVGTYKTTAPITFNSTTAFSVCISGEGEGSFISGTTAAGYTFDRKLVSPNNIARVVFEKLNITNNDGTAGTGSIRVGSSNSVIVHDCHLGGVNPITTEDSAGNSSQNILIQNIRISGGTNGIIMGGSGAIMGCDVRGCTTAYRLYGDGWLVSGFRVERSDTGILIGLDSAGTDQGASGFSIMGGSMEGNKVAIDVAGTISAFYIGQIAFLPHFSPNSGASGLEDPERGLYIRANKAVNGVISSIGAGGDGCTVAQIEIGASTGRANILVEECTATVLAGGGAAYVYPSNAYTARYLNCSNGGGGSGTGQPIWTYSQLPTGGNVLEGDEFNISDGTNGLSWGDPATNTGTHTTHYLVRRNDSGWTVVGK